MSGTLIFVVVLAVAAAVIVLTTSVVGSRRRTQGRRLDVQVRGFGKRRAAPASGDHTLLVPDRDGS